MTPVLFMAEWDMPRSNGDTQQKGHQGAFGTTYLLYCGHRHFHYSAWQRMFWNTEVYSVNNFFQWFMTFSSWLLFCPCWFPSHIILSGSVQPWSSAPSAHMLLYSLGEAACFLTRTQVVLVSGFLYNALLRWFPSLWKLSSHSEASLLSFSPC